MSSINAQTFGITDMNVWQSYQRNQSITPPTSGGANAINEWGIFYGPGGKTNRARPTAYAMSLQNGCISTGGTGFAVTPASVHTANFTASNGVNAYSNVPQMYGFGYKTGSNRCLLVYNFDQSSSQTFTVSGTNAPSGTIT